MLAVINHWHLARAGLFCFIPPLRPPPRPLRLRGPYKRNEYRKVILPLTGLRRFDCVLAALGERDETAEICLDRHATQWSLRAILRSSVLAPKGLRRRNPG